MEHVYMWVGTFVVSAVALALVVLAVFALLVTGTMAIAIVLRHVGESFVLASKWISAFGRWLLDAGADLLAP